MIDFSVGEARPLQASKWIKVQALLSVEEMGELLEEVGGQLVLVSRPVGRDGAVVKRGQFLAVYGEYVECLQKGEVPDFARFREYFSCALSVEEGAFYAVEVSGGRYLVKPCHPVIQLQAHHFVYSAVDGTFHSMVLSQNSVTWGLQFSFPQWMQDPKTFEIQKVRDTDNAAAFVRLRRWMRDKTLPSGFVVGGKRVNVPMRIGKGALKWVGKHPQLQGELTCALS